MIAVLFFSWILLSAEAAKECYWANGQSLETTETTGYVPCYPTAAVSHCCLRGEACLDNGLCFGSLYGIPYRGACTEPAGSVCGGRTYCSGFTMWANLYICANGSFWCGTGAQCTADALPYEFLSWPHGEVIGVANQTQDSVSSSSVTNQPQGSLSCSTNQTQGSVSSSSVTGQTKGSVSSSSVTEQTQGSFSGSTYSSTTPSTTVPIGVGVAIGIGVPPAITSITLGSLYLQEWKRRKAIELSSSLRELEKDRLQNLPLLLRLWRT